MKTLWTPWRMEHVLDTAPRPQGCLFEPPGDKPFAGEYLLLYRDRLTVVLLNRFPYANGHLLVAPRRHLADITELAGRENSALMVMLQHCCTILRRRLRPDGINIGLNLGGNRRRRDPGPSPLPCCSPLGGRSQLHDRDRRNQDHSPAYQAHLRAVAA